MDPWRPPPRPCISYFLLSVTRIPDKEQHKTGRIYIGSWFQRSQLSMAVKVWSEEHIAKFLHIVGSQEVESSLNLILSNNLQRQ